MDSQEPLDKEKIDIWGVGAVMLCVVCSLFVEPGKKFEEFLQNIKADPKLLDDTYKRLLGVSLSIFLYFYIFQMDKWIYSLHTIINWNLIWNFTV